ncbi:hypothetical protein [Maribacter luteus]|uniref:hypothetical protein n=1 Tax=Maribacter luteus TaxID=2594478 RepID=UPI0024928946|nr:hypothetical protein [Maribacter luteus]
MKFTAYTYRIGKSKISTTRFLLYLAITFVALGFILKLLNDKMPLFENIEAITYYPFILGFIFYCTSFVYQYFDYERLEHEKIGHLELNDEGIIVNHEDTIKYEQLADIDIQAGTYHGQKTPVMFPQSPSPTHRTGLENKIRISSKTIRYDLNFGLENEYHLDSFYLTLFKLIVIDKFKNISTKKIMNLIPSQFKNSPEYKAFVVKLIQEKRLNCTDGLLLHGYKTDKEAQELRKKYCG